MEEQVDSQDELVGLARAHAQGADFEVDSIGFGPAFRGVHEELTRVLCGMDYVARVSMAPCISTGSECHETTKKKKEKESK